MTLNLGNLWIELWNGSDAVLWLLTSALVKWSSGLFAVSWKTQSGTAPERKTGGSSAEISDSVSGVRTAGCVHGVSLSRGFRLCGAARVRRRFYPHLQTLSDQLFYEL